MNEELNRLKSEKEQIQIVGSVHVDYDWDIRIFFFFKGLTRMTSVAI